MNSKQIFIKILLILFANHTTYSQSNAYLGTLILNDSTFISYKLDFTIYNDTIKGYSLSDIGGPNETKSNIIGSYKNKILSFKEYGIIYTKSEFEDIDFCYVNFEDKIGSLNEKTTIKGDFRGKFSDNTDCIHGKLLLKNQNYITNKINKIAKKIENSKRYKRILKEKGLPNKELKNNHVNTIKKNENTGLFTSSKNITLKIWDNGKEDGDITTIKVNNSHRLRNYKISPNPKTFKINLDQKLTKIDIIAVCEGDVSHNTSSIQLIENDSISHEILTYLKKGEKSTITIVKKDELTDILKP